MPAAATGGLKAAEAAKRSWGGQLGLIDELLLPNALREGPTGRMAAGGKQTTSALGFHKSLHS